MRIYPYLCHPINTIRHKLFTATALRERYLNERATSRPVIVIVNVIV